MATPSVKRCQNCGKIARPTGPKLTCPWCGTSMAEPQDVLVPAPPPPPTPFGKPRSTGMVPPPPPQVAIPTFAPSAPPPVDGPSFPERMKANKVLAGRICPSCNRAIDLGQDIFNCQTCHGTMHQACWDRTRNCQQPNCPTRQASAVAAQGSMAPAAAGATGDTKPCAYCGEQILKSAKKCRFCGEFLNPADRAKQEKLVKAASENDTLSSTEWVFGVLFALCLPIVPCILSLIWIAQGKKKGTTMLVISLVGMGFGVLVQGLLGRH